MAPGTTHVCRFMGEGAVEKEGNPSPTPIYNNKVSPKDVGGRPE